MDTEVTIFPAARKASTVRMERERVDRTEVTANAADFLFENLVVNLRVKLTRL